MPIDKVTVVTESRRHEIVNAIFHPEEVISGENPFEL